MFGAQPQFPAFDWSKQGLPMPRMRNLRFIGNESNKLEEVEEGSVPDVGDVFTEYPDPRRDEWATKILPILRRAPVSTIMRDTRMSRRPIQRIRSGSSKPTVRHKLLLEDFARKWLRAQGRASSAND